ncbi:hypothetical protein MHYP_G00269050 [Metynnis hypsauchen]
MANEDSDRKGLVWKIRKSLHTLTADELFQISQTITEVPELTHMTVVRGIAPKYSDVRSELKPLLSDPTISDETHDQGAQVSILDRKWRQMYLPDHTVRPLSELMGTKPLSVLAVNGETVPFDGWVEVTVNLPGNSDPDLSIQVPFLVGSMPLECPILGFNIIEQLIKRQQSGTKALATIANLLSGAMEIEDDKTNAIVNFIQTKRANRVDQALVKVGHQDIVIWAGQVAHVRCKQPDTLLLSLLCCLSQLRRVCD